MRERKIFENKFGKRRGYEVKREDQRVEGKRLRLIQELMLDEVKVS